MPVLLNDELPGLFTQVKPFSSGSRRTIAEHGLGVGLECHHSLPQRLTSPDSWHHASLPLADAYESLVRLDIATFPRTGCCNLPAMLCTSCQELFSTRQAAGPSGNSCKMPHPMQTSFGPVAPVLLTAIIQVTPSLQQEGKQRITHLATWRQRNL